MKFVVEDITKHPTAKIEPKEIYATLWRCRDFEISHLWQRSVFLTAFLLLVYSGYGLCVFNQIKMINVASDEVFTIITLCGLLFLFIGMVLSQLWIMMAKGSKAWYERYEKAIYQIEHDDTFSQSVVVETMKNKKVMHGNLPFPSVCDRNLFRTNAGAFSPSRINVFIGQFSWVILFFFYICHTTLCVLSGKVIFWGYKPCCLILYSIIIALVLNLMFYFIIRQIVTSKTLLEE